MKSNGKSNGHDPEKPGEISKIELTSVSGGGARHVAFEVLGVGIVEFTKHADDQMKVRGISEFEVLKTLKSPQETGLPTQIMRHRVRRYRTSKLAVDVVYEMRPDRVIVITAILVKITLR